MMRVRFLVDFRGKLTRERFYLAGEEVDVDESAGTVLIGNGFAEAVPPEQPPIEEVVEQLNESANPKKSRRK